MVAPLLIKTLCSSRWLWPDPLSVNFPINSSSNGFKWSLPWVLLGIAKWWFLKILGTFLVAHWLGIHLPMQRTRVRSLVREDPTCLGATKPVHHNYWACALGPPSHNCWSPRATTTEARVPRAHAPQQEKPPQWEARAPQWRVALLRATRESPRAATKTQCSQK